MTLLVSLQGKDGIALATDSRATYGDPRLLTAQNDTVTKLFKVSSQAAILLAGAGELGYQMVLRATKEVNEQGKNGVTEVMEHFRKTALEQYEDWFKGIELEKRPNIATIIAGYDVVGKKGTAREPKLYTLNSALNFAPQLSTTGFLLQGIPQYALYILNRLYTKERSAEELIHLATYSITETATQDGKVGGPVQGLIIKADGTSVEINEEKIEEIITQNKDRSERLKTSFFAPVGEEQANV